MFHVPGGVSWLCALLLHVDSVGMVLCIEIPMWIGSVWVCFRSVHDVYCCRSVYFTHKPFGMCRIGQSPKSRGMEHFSEGGPAAPGRLSWAEGV